MSGYSASFGSWTIQIPPLLFMAIIPVVPSSSKPVKIRGYNRNQPKNYSKQSWNFHYNQFSEKSFEQHAYLMYWLPGYVTSTLNQGKKTAYLYLFKRQSFFNIISILDTIRSSTYTITNGRSILNHP